jgi:subtilisin family serine protease
LLALAACGGGGGDAASNDAANNPTVSAQVQDLQPSDPADSVGVFVQLQTATPASGASVTADDARELAQSQFLADLAEAAKRPAVGASTGTSCDVSALSARIAQAYKPKSGTAVRIELSACELGLLPQIGNVKGVFADIPLSTNQVATSNTVAALNKAVVDGFDGSKAWPSYTVGGNALQAVGAGTVIAVLDTGVDERHPAFNGTGKVLKGACFSTPSAGSVGFCPNGATVDTVSADAGRSCVDKFGSAKGGLALSGGCGHGTSMAGAAGMAYANGAVAAGGLAKAASILPVQVFNGSINNGKISVSANSGDLLAGIEWVTAQAQARIAAGQPRIVAMNLSLGGGSFSAACDSNYVGGLFFTAFANLRAQGVVPVVAAGNSFNTTAISFPACVSNTVSVAATKLGGTTPASYTNFSSQVKLFAIGGDIEARYSMPTPCPSASQGFECWAPGAGTSPATAMVSGAVAVLRSLKPGASLAEIEAALLTSDKSLTLNGQTRPLLRTSKAGAQLLGVAGVDTPPAPPPPPQQPPPQQPPPPAPPVAAELTQLCVYSGTNYTGHRACGVFAKGSALVSTGSWQVASLRFFAFDIANPTAAAPLAANPFPTVTLYDTLTRISRNGASGVVVKADSADLTGVLPSRGQVRMLTFEWPAN